MPSAAQCVEAWKKEIFKSHHPGIAVDDSTEVAIWFKDRYKNSQIPSNEYAFYAEEYATASSRQQFFASLADNSTPSVGYEMLALLTKAEIVKAVWTTNFDGLALKAVSAAGYRVREACLDTAWRTRSSFKPRELLHVALHGDYRYDSLKNLPTELVEQDAVLAAALRRRVEEYPLIVIGYSGRDESIMRTLSQAYRRHFNGLLYWCGTQPQHATRVAEFLVKVARYGAEAFYVADARFDELMRELALHCLEGDLLACAKSLDAKRTGPIPPSRIQKPKPIVQKVNGHSYASLNLASNLIAKATLGSGEFPANALLLLSDLPSFRIDFKLIERDGLYGAIFKAFLTDDSGKEKEVWARVAAIPSAAGKEMDLKEVPFCGINHQRGRHEKLAEGEATKGALPQSDDFPVIRTGLDTLAVFGSRREEVLDALPISFRR